MLYPSKIVTDFINVTPIEPTGSYLSFYREILNIRTIFTPSIDNLLGMYKYCKQYPDKVDEEIKKDLFELLHREIGDEVSLIDEILLTI